MSEAALMIAAIAIIMALGWLFWLVINAPMGHEYEEGFHYDDRD